MPGVKMTAVMITHVLDINIIIVVIVVNIMINTIIVRLEQVS